LTALAANLKVPYNGLLLVRQRAKVGRAYSADFFVPYWGLAVKKHERRFFGSLGILGTRKGHQSGCPGGGCT
jgi:hypothetical protein